MDIDETDVEEGSWNHCFIGHFLDGKMNFKLLNSMAEKVWKDNVLQSNRLDRDSCSNSRTRLLS